jgi:alkanesulfonate monooxygenase SsuD/methylene tetrahydromethanopterin reductase-like flavin-dependent oxidoreductase (luciferase family)
MTRADGRGVLTCLAVEGRFLDAASVPELREQALWAQAGGAAAVFVGEGTLGDPIVLAAGVAASVHDVWLGVRIALESDGRHPAMLARESTSLDLISEGPSVLCFEPPFDDDLAEAITLCRALWHEGVVARQGPSFPAYAPATRARPLSDASPLVALDLTAGDSVPSSFRGLVDLLLRPTPDPLLCQMEHQ